MGGIGVVLLAIFSAGIFADDNASILNDSIFNGHSSTTLLVRTAEDIRFFGDHLGSDAVQPAGENHGAIINDTNPFGSTHSQSGITRIRCTPPVLSGESVPALPDCWLWNDMSYRIKSRVDWPVINK